MTLRSILPHDVLFDLLLDPVTLASLSYQLSNLAFYRKLIVKDLNPEGAIMDSRRPIAICSLDLRMTLIRMG